MRPGESAVKASTILLLIAAILIGLALAGQFDPLRDAVSASLTGGALMLGLVLTFAGLAVAQRERKRG